MGIFQKLLASTAPPAAVGAPAWRSTSKLSFFELEQRTVFDGAMAATADEIVADPVSGSDAPAEATDGGSTNADATVELFEALGLGSDASGNSDNTQVADPTVGETAEIVSPAPVSSSEAASVLPAQDQNDPLAAVTDGAKLVTEIVFVDTSVENYQTIVDDIIGQPDSSRVVEVVLIERDENGIQRISDTLSQFENIDAVHVISHGNDGSVILGNTVLNAATLQANSSLVSGWGSAFSETGDLLFYGCDLAESDKGEALIDALARLTDADVAASDDQTGHESLGGDWDLEYATGSIEAEVAVSQQAQSNWESLLATLTVTNTSDLANGDTSSIANLISSDGGDGISLREAIIAANNTVGTDTIDFNIAGAGPHTINLTTDLSVITDTVIIDGSSEPDYVAGTPVIELNGIGSANIGLRLGVGSDGSTIRGLIINNFDGDGIDVDSANNTIVGNWIGLDNTGTVDQGNGGEGIDISGAGNTVGGITLADRNVISGNSLNGVDLRSSGNTVIGNYIGTDFTGTLDLGNSNDGITVRVGADNNIIGGLTAAERNVISGNDDDGIEITGSASNTVQGNYIGVDATGLVGLGNANHGLILFNGSNNNTIGGSVAGAGNVISANGGDGIVINGNGGSTTDNNVITGNYIGTNKDGTAALSNGSNGIRIYGGADTNRIGGTLAAERNIISGNTIGGVYIEGANTDNNTVLGNYVGVDVTGTVAIGNGSDGIKLWTGPSNTIIGGTVAGSGNLIGGNGQYGVFLEGAGTDNNIIQGNIIGTDATGAINLGNTRGVELAGGVADNLIGGLLVGAGNIIAFNSADGIMLNLSTGARNTIQRNSIYSNGGLGIDIDGDGVTTNDAGDGDGGPNNRQNFPVLVSAITFAGNTTISGSFNSNASTTFTIEYFSSPSGDGSGFGEAQTYLGSDTIATDGAGNAVINTTFIGLSLTSGHVVTATATHADGSTSEFAQNVIATSNILVVDTISDVSDGDTSSISNLVNNKGADGFISLREAIEATNNAPNGIGPDEIHFNIAGPGPHTISLLSALPDIVDSVIIDGTTDPDFAGTPIIELDGSGAGAGVDGLHLVAGSDGSTIRGLVINRFTDDGIDISSDNNVIAGNWIGLNNTGVLDLGNTDNGIEIKSAGNIIGGTTVADGNVISGNDNNGVLLTSATATGNLIQGNYIGTDVTGTLDLGNNSTGVVLSSSASNNTIGGATAASRNIISGNDAFGIVANGANSNTIQNNYIGTDVTGNLDLGNANTGVRIINSASTIIDSNVISGNDNVGIEISGAASTGTIITGNYIGLNAAGNATLTNTQTSIDISSAGAVTIGGALASEGNVIIAAALRRSIQIANTSGSIIEGNLIGTDALGTTQLSSGATAVFLLNAANTQIGGLTVAEANVVAGYSNTAININGGGSSGIAIEGNFIGTDKSGTLDLTDGLYGIVLQGSAAGIAIGGVASGAGNVITNHSTSGIRLLGDAGNANQINRNNIYNNAGRGIDIGLDFANYNDAEDVDGGANDLLNFPVLTNVVQNGANLDINFDVDLPAGNYRIEFFDNPGGLDASGFGEGETYIGFANITVTGAAGYESFSTTLLSVTASAITNITTTATEADGTFTNFSSTSEFGPQFIGAGVLEVDTTSDVSDGDTSSIAALLGNRGADGFISLREAIIATNNTANIAGNPDEIRFDILANDARHFYYADDGLAGQVTLANIATTTQVLDASIVGIDPDHAYSWYSIQPTSALPFLSDSVSINGYTQTGSQPNTLAVGSDAILKIEVDGSLAGGSVDGLVINTDNSTISGLIVNNFGDDGIFIPFGFSGNVISGNYSGVDASGTIALANGDDGIDVNGSSNTIGGTTVASRNLFSGNSGYGIDVDGSSNLVQGNYIGTNAAGTAAVGNGSHGIGVEIGASNNQIGGTTVAERNVISGNTNNGILISGGGTSGNTIQGNYVGINATGTSTLGSQITGVYVELGADNTNITGNTIGGSLQRGIEIWGTSSATTIQGNNIGTDASGALNFANGWEGIYLGNGAAGTLIGGTLASNANKIANNGGDGIRVENSAGSGNSILRNSIFSNSNLGIDLQGGTEDVNGVTANDLNDADVGANNLQNYPVISQADLTGTNLTLSGTLDTDGVATQYRLEFYGNAGGTQDATNGEGRTYLGAIIVVTNGSGNGTFSGAVLSGITLSAGDFVTATATRIDNPAQVGIDDGLAYGDTSEFAANIIVSGNVAPVITSNGGGVTASINVAENLSIVTTVTATDADIGDIPTYSISGGADAALFNINSSTGALNFIAAPDFETPIDTGGDNIYDLTVEADDGNGGTDSQAISVTVTDVDTPTVVGTSSGSTTDQPTVTVSHTVLSNNELMLVGISMEPDGESVSSVTYNGTNLTLVGIEEDASGGARVEIWVLQFPATGVFDVVVNLTGTDHQGVVVGVNTFTEFNQTTPLLAFASDSGDSATASTTVSSATDDVVFSVVQSHTGTAATPGVGQTEHWDIEADHANGSGTTQAGAATVTPTWTVNNDKWSVAAIAIQAESNGSTNVAPTAVFDNFVIAEGASSNLNLAANDTDPDDGLDLASITIKSGPTNGTITAINADGTVDYTHDGSETLADSFTYTIDDNSSSVSNIQTVNLTITPVNDTPTFVGGDGILTTAIGAGDDVGQDTVIQPDGKIIVAGYTHNGTDLDFLITRYNADGTLDTTFGGGGSVTTALGAGDDYANTVLLQADGKIVASGATHNGVNYDFGVVRYNADGTLDTSFGGGDGIVTTNLRTGGDHPRGIALQSDGKLIVGGYANGPTYDFAVVRYTAAGVLDTTFGSGTGMAFTDVLAGDDFGFDLTVQSDDKILIAGYSWNGTDYDSSLVRYNADGSIDLTFGGGDGIVTTAIGAGDDRGRSVALQPDDKILVGGYSGNDFAVTRYNSNGTLDVTFGGGAGFVTTAIGVGVDSSYDISIQADGKILLSGTSNNGTDNDFAVVRYNSDGTLDTSFSANGILTTPIGAANETGRSIAVQSDGKIVVVGDSDNGTDQDVALVRYNADGSLDGSFDSVLANTLDGTPTFVEDGPAVVLDSDVDVRDVDLDALNGGAGDYDGSSLTLVRNGGANAEDVLSFNNGNGITLVGGNVLQKAGATIATFDVLTTSGQLVITFTNANGQTPTSADVDNILRQLTYSNSSGAPPANVQIDWTFDDGNVGAQGSGGALNVVGSTTITITPTNDVPVATGNTVVASEDVPLVIGSGDFNFTDVEGDGLVSVTITGLNLNGGTLTHTTGTITVINGMTVTLAQLADLTFASALNDSTNSSFTYTVNDAGLGAVSSTMNITVNAVNDVPVATGNTVVTNEDVSVVIGPGNFSFTDVEGNALVSVTINGLNLNGGSLTHSAGAVSVSNGMTVTLAQLADLTFAPALNNDTNSSFTYTVNDAGSGVVSSTMNITVNPINDAPVNVIDAATLFYSAATGTTPVDSALVIIDVDSANLVSAIVSITSGYISAEDRLRFTDQLGITGIYNIPTGMLTLTGSASVADYQTALRSVSYENINFTPTQGNFTVDFTVNDGSLNSTVDTRMVTVVPNAPPIAVDDVSAVNEGGSVIINLAVNDTDAESQLDITSIAIVASPSNGSLVINGDGTITYTHNDSETLTDTFTYTIDDMANLTSNTATVTITINPVNDNTITGISDADAGVNNVNENVAIGTTVGFTAFANDIDTTDTVTYTLDNNDGGRFAIDLNSGVVTVAGSIDREADGASRNITVRATSTDGSFSTQIFAIAINDVNEFAVTPVVDVDGTANNVDENVAIGTVVGITANASDVDATNNVVTYTLDNNDGGRFAIDLNSGVVRVAGSIDREADGASRNITVRATSTDGSFSTQIFAIAINDVNEFAIGPVVDVDVSLDAVNENSVIGSVVGITANATDADSTDVVTYTLDNNDGGRFAIDLNSGVVTVAGAIDREADGASRNITVRATSTDGSFSTQIFAIAINDVNEFAVTPVVDVDAGANNVDENVAIGTVVGIAANASDADSTDVVTYTLDNNDGGRFAIDLNSGVVTVAGAIDREAIGPSRNITVRATSTDGSFSIQIFAIAINDVNEFAITPVVDVDGTLDAVNENAAIGTVVGITGNASDADATTNVVTYTLVNNDGGRFAIDLNSGVVTVAGIVDREADGPIRNITIRATSIDGSFSTRVFSIAINDVNEFVVTPVVDVDGTVNNVDENVAIGTVVGITANATDADSTDVVTYTLDNNDGGRFAIDLNSGVVTVAGAIDREADGASRNITVRATSTDGSFSIQIFAIAINDVNEFAITPVVDVDGTLDAVNENAAIGTVVGITANASDVDATNNVVTYTLDNNDGGRFAIDLNSGVVRVAGAIDREADGASRNITVRATSTDGSFSTQVFAIAINDVNEFAVTPVVDVDGTANNVDENVAIGTVVGITANATDADATTNVVTYSLDNNDGGRFAIDLNSGVVTVAGAIDREADGASRNITVRAASTDGSFSTQIFAIAINDVNEFAITPVVDVDAGANNVDENVAIGTVVGIAANATDTDATDSVTYTLDNNDGGRFAIDLNSGAVTVAGAIDREAIGPSRNITVRATSTDGSFSTQIFAIAINDVNEFAVTPVVDVDAGANNVDENVAIGTVVGITANATDADATTNVVTYTLDNNDGGRFAIDLNSGVVTVAGAIDREADGASRNLTVRATSADGSFSTQIFAIAINDVNEFAVTPVVDVDAGVNNVDENVAAGTIVGITANASDADATTNVVSYTLDNNDGGRFAINLNSGVLTVAGAIDREADGPSRSITVRATSADGSVKVLILNIIINDVDDTSIVTAPPADPTTDPTDPDGPETDEPTVITVSIPTDPDLPDDDGIIEVLIVLPTEPKAISTGPNSSTPKSNAPNIGELSLDEPDYFENSILDNELPIKEWVKLPTIDLGLKEVNKTAFFKAIDEVNSEMTQSHDAWQSNIAKLSAGTSLALTAGYVSWILSSGALLSAMMASISVWQTYDPLFVILGRRKNEKKKEEGLSKADRLFSVKSKFDIYKNGVGK